MGSVGGPRWGRKVGEAVTENYDETAADPVDEIRVIVYKAQTSHDKPVPKLVIESGLPIKGGPEQMEKDAEYIARALRLCLPGGTLDRLTIILLQRVVTDYRVAHKEKA